MKVCIERTVLDDSRLFFEQKGALGCEGTAMIMANRSNLAYRLVIPEQEANPVPRCWVQVTKSGKTELALALGPDDRYVARIHSHPGEAFHSLTDESNPALTNEGALSIVVPYFGLGLRRGLDACEVYVLRNGAWQSLPAGQERAELIEVNE